MEEDYRISLANVLMAEESKTTIFSIFANKTWPKVIKKTLEWLWTPGMPFVSDPFYAETTERFDVVRVSGNYP